MSTVIWSPPPQTIIDGFSPYDRYNYEIVLLFSRLRSLGVYLRPEYDDRSSLYFELFQDGVAIATPPHQKRAGWWTLCEARAFYNAAVEPQMPIEIENADDGDPEFGNDAADENLGKRFDRVQEILMRHGYGIDYMCELDRERYWIFLPLDSSAEPPMDVQLPDGRVWGLAYGPTEVEGAWTLEEAEKFVAELGQADPSGSVCSEGLLDILSD